MDTSCGDVPTRGDDGAGWAWRVGGAEGGGALRRDGRAGPADPPQGGWVHRNQPALQVGPGPGPARHDRRLDEPDGQPDDTPGTGTLGFLLIVANAAGMDSIPLTIPTEGRARGPNLSSLRADAGDDQLGMVGHQITLNGIRSEPRDQIGYRWIQTGGPSVRLKIEDGYLYSFVPSEPGTYRLALVVASGGEISEPDEVRVTVIPEGSPAVGSSVATGSTAARVRRMEPLERSFRMAFASLDIGSSLSNELSQTFVAIAGRMNLYRSYDEAFSEISRRLDAIVPQDPARRGVWIERLFAPMTTWMIEEMRGEGLDLSTPGGRASAMTATQRDRLAEIFRAIGEGFRPSSPSPG